MNKSGRNYKVKKGPVIIAIVVLILVLVILVAIAVSLFNKSNDIGATGSEVSTPTSDGVNSNVIEDELEDEVVDAGLGELGELGELVENSGVVDEQPVPEAAVVNTLPNGFLRDWNLILVNSEEQNGLESELYFSISKFDMQIIDTRINDAYKAMYEHAKSDGITLYIKTGYRSIEQQLVLYTFSIQKYMEQGYSREDAIIKTEQDMAKPGHSEHHTGLGLDIISPSYHMEVFYLDERFAQTTEYAWLMQNAVNYGFVLRYPADKTDITKVSYEPWHFRYVGVEHAAYMAANNLCLEEYIQVLANAGR